jgi:glycosyltransferase involved in cell wall biosynthesis
MLLRFDIRTDGRVRKEIRSLTRAGHDVELVVSDYTKTGTGGEDLGIKIHYVPLNVWWSPAINFAEDLWFNHRIASIVKRIRPTHIHCHDLNTLLAGVWVKDRLNATLIFDAHELMPESMGGIKEVMWGFIERRCIARCDYIFMPEKHRIAYFLEKYPYIPQPFLLENFPRQSDIPKKKYDLFRKKYPIDCDKKIILYSGIVHPKRQIEELVNSMAICSEAFVLVILGNPYKNYHNVLQKKIKSLGVEDKVFIHDQVPHTDILQYMASCDIGTAFYPNTNINNYYCASNKIYEYIALEKKILTNNHPGLLEVVDRGGHGLCLEKVTAQSLADAYTSLAKAELSLTPKKYYWEDQEDTLLQIYETQWR